MLKWMNGWIRFLNAKSIEQRGSDGEGREAKPHFRLSWHPFSLVRISFGIFLLSFILFPTLLSGLASLDHGDDEREAIFVSSSGMKYKSFGGGNHQPPAVRGRKLRVDATCEMRSQTLHSDRHKETQNEWMDGPTERYIIKGWGHQHKWTWFDSRILLLRSLNHVFVTLVFILSDDESGLWWSGASDWHNNSFPQWIKVAERSQLTETEWNKRKFLVTQIHYATSIFLLSPVWYNNNHSLTSRQLEDMRTIRQSPGISHPVLLKRMMMMTGHSSLLSMIIFADFNHCRIISHEASEEIRTLFIGRKTRFAPFDTFDTSCDNRTFVIITQWKGMNSGLINDMTIRQQNTRWLFWWRSWYWSFLVIDGSLRSVLHQLNQVSKSSIKISDLLKCQ